MLGQHTLRRRRSSGIACGIWLACLCQATFARAAEPVNDSAIVAGARPAIVHAASSTADSAPLNERTIQLIGATATADPFLEQLELAISVTSRRYLTANTHSPWQIFHGILALKKDFLLKVDDQKVSAIEWIATSNPKWDNEPWLQVTEFGGRFHKFTRAYAFEGHPSQSLALLSQSNLPPSFVFKAGDREITIHDIIRNTMMEVNDKEEITWVLWALNNYLKPEARWQNKTGEPWSIERLVQIQVDANVNNGACGGNHGLFALARARDKAARGGKQLRGAWLQADHKVKQYLEFARVLQNSDGSFSANFYEGPEFSKDLNSRLNTTGHTLEFVVNGLPTERLNEQWVRNAVWRLSKDLADNRHQQADCGPLYHSLNALITYRDRIKPPETFAAAPNSTVSTPTQLPGDQQAPEAGTGAANSTAQSGSTNPGSTGPVPPGAKTFGPTANKPSAANNPPPSAPSGARPIRSASASETVTGDSDGSFDPEAPLSALFGECGMPLSPNPDQARGESGTTTK